MLYPVFDRFTTFTVVPIKRSPQSENVVFRLFGLYPLGARLCVTNSDWLKGHPTLESYVVQPYWHRHRFAPLGNASLAELQRVAAMLRRKPNKSQAEASVLTRLEATIEAAQIHDSHPGTATVPTVQ